MNNSRIAVIVAVIFGIIFSGCARQEKEATGDNRVLARINEYELTVKDFKDEVRHMRETRGISRDTLKTKRLILEDIIAKKVLLQEAQKEHFDKDKKFMKKIERYWEQALLKLLIEKKQKEMSERIEISSAEVTDDYERLSRQILAEMYILNERKAALMLSVTTEDIDEVKEELKDKIVTTEPPRWWSSGELPLYVEKVMFSLKPGEATNPIKLGDDWLVIRVLDEKSRQIEPIENVALLVRNNILRRKGEIAIKAWMDDLRKKASVKVNEEVFEEIDIN